MRWETLRERDLVTVDDLLEDPSLIPGVSRSSLYEAINRGQLGEPVRIGRRMFLSTVRLADALGLPLDEDQERSDEW